MRGLLVAGNWKMNGLAAEIAEAERIAANTPQTGCEVLLCPPAVLLSRMAERLAGTSVWLGGQDCHTSAAGAHTGDCSASMLADAGAAFVIVGHSERRRGHGESNGLIQQKVLAAWGAGLTAILCVGESAAERDAGNARAVVQTQLAACVPNDADAGNLVIAYEPVWAIGTGRTAGVDEIETMHGYIRSECIRRFGNDSGSKLRLLYGGSVNGGNAEAIFSVNDVNGALVGGASLRAQDFIPIVRAARPGN